jgi:hypothetical protein
MDAPAGLTVQSAHLRPEKSLRDKDMTTEDASEATGCPQQSEIGEQLIEPQVEGAESMRLFSRDEAL